MNFLNFDFKMFSFAFLAIASMFNIVSCTEILATSQSNPSDSRESEILSASARLAMPGGSELLEARPDDLSKFEIVKFFFPSKVAQFVPEVSEKFYKSEYLKAAMARIKKQEGIDEVVAEMIVRSLVYVHADNMVSSVTHGNKVDEKLAELITRIAGGGNSSKFAKYIARINETAGEKEHEKMEALEKEAEKDPILKLLLEADIYNVNPDKNQEYENDLWKEQTEQFFDYLNAVFKDYNKELKVASIDKGDLALKKQNLIEMLQKLAEGSVVATAASAKVTDTDKKVDEKEKGCSNTTIVIIVIVVLVVLLAAIAGIAISMKKNQHRQ